ncbi:MAG: sugar phosphate isomerase/epimerase family protein [Bryobacteraceae bacterium]
MNMSARGTLSRRSLLCTATLAACIADYGKQQQTLGVQLYTVRDIVLKRPPEILRRIAEIGYREVEVLPSQIEPLAPYLKTLPLRPVSVHFESPLITGNWQAWKDDDMPAIDERYTFGQALIEAKAHGFEYMVFNYLPPKERGGLDFYRGLAEKLNVAGEKCRETGLRLCYHNHDFEFEPKPGGRPIEVLLQRLDKGLVGLEVDAFWVSMAGENASNFIRQNASRVEMVHLKDRKPGTPRTFDVASVPNDTFREVGNGDLNFREILHAASEARVKHYFVEQDYSPDPLRSLSQSYENVRKLGF